LDCHDRSFHLLFARCYTFTTDMPDGAILRIERSRSPDIKSCRAALVTTAVSQALESNEQGHAFRLALVPIRVCGRTNDILSSLEVVGINR